MPIFPVRLLPFLIRGLFVLGMCSYGFSISPISAQHSFRQLQLRTDGQNRIKFIKLHAQNKKFNLLISPDTLQTALAHNWEISGTILADVEGRITYSLKKAQEVWEFSLGQNALFAIQDTQEVYLWYLYANQDTLAVKSFIQDEYEFYASSLIKLQHAKHSTPSTGTSLLITIPQVAYIQQNRNKAKFITERQDNIERLSPIQHMAGAFLCLISYYRLSR